MTYPNPSPYPNVVAYTPKDHGDLSSRQGATPRELVLEACRRNNTDLLQEVIDSFHKKSPKTAEQDLAELLNTARDGIGQGVLHVAAANGNCMSSSFEGRR